MKYNYSDIPNLFDGKIIDLYGCNFDSTQTFYTSLEEAIDNAKEEQAKLKIMRFTILKYVYNGKRIMFSNSKVVYHDCGKLINICVSAVICSNIPWRTSPLISLDVKQLIEGRIEKLRKKDQWKIPKLNIIQIIWDSEHHMRLKLYEK